MEVGGQRHAPATLPPGKTGTHCIGGWVGPKAVLDGCGKSHPPPRNSIPGPSNPQGVVIPTATARQAFLATCRNNILFRTSVNHGTCMLIP